MENNQETLTTRQSSELVLARFATNTVNALRVLSVATNIPMAESMRRAVNAYIYWQLGDPAVQAGCIQRLEQLQDLYGDIDRIIIKDNES